MSEGNKTTESRSGITSNFRSLLSQGSKFLSWLKDIIVRPGYPQLPVVADLWSSSECTPEMQLHVRTITGPSISVNLRPEQKISDLKEALQSSHGFAIWRQNLYLGATELLDDWRLCDYNMCDGTTLNLVLDMETNLPFYVNLPSGKCLALSMPPTSTIQEVKSRIQATEGTPVDMQRLIAAGINLEDYQTLSECQIDAEAVIYLQSFATSCPLSIQILTANESLWLNVMSEDTITSVKRMIEDYLDYPCEWQRLIFEGRQLEDDHRLKEYNVEDKATLHLDIFRTSILRAAEIVVNLPTGESLSLDVLPSDTIGMVKRQISFKSEIPSDEQSVIFDEAELFDEQTLRESGVFNQDTLEVKRCESARSSRPDSPTRQPYERSLFQSGFVTLPRSPLPSSSESVFVQPRIPAPPVTIKAEIFISYNWDIQKTVIGLYNNLTALGYTCWMDRREMGGGDEMVGEIVKALKHCKVMISCITPEYIISENCINEVSLAATYKNQLKKEIIPLILGEVDWPLDSEMAFYLTRKVYIDFRESKDEMTSWNGVKTKELLQQLEKFGVTANKVTNTPRRSLVSTS